VLTYLTDPLLAGVYGGDSSVLSAKSVLPRFVGYERQFGSLVKGVRHESKVRTERGKSLFLSFRGGMSTLVNALGREIRDSVRIVAAEATDIVAQNEAWTVAAGGQQLTSRRVVLACPAHTCARLVRPFSSPLSSHLDAIPYSSAILVSLLFDRSTFPHPLNGFGFLVPRKERTTVAAATWINTKFPSRIAPDLVGLRAFIIDPEATNERNTSASELTAKTVRDLEKLMGIRQGPIYSSVTRWPFSMPQYVVGHQARIEEIENLLSQHRGLYLVSNYLGGVGIPDCIERAQKTAKQIALTLNVK
jgi:oxygen-dependent protoporphyrinogen oxidase